jgi:hypothetical protein
VASLPTEYQQYLERYGAFEGSTSGEPGYIALWSIAEIPSNNADIQIQQYAPGYLAFAGNGGGEVLAFNSAGEVFMLPLIGMGPQHATRVASSFAELAARFNAT